MKYLAIGAGAMGYFAYLGCLKSIYKPDEVVAISGSSCGSILALFLGMGWPIDRILEASLSIDTGTLCKPSIKSLIRSYGLIPHEQLKEKMIEICEGNPTFTDMKKDIYITSFCLNTKKTVYFSKHTHPNMAVIDAVLMSISVPFVFSGVTYEGEMYVDGALNERWPAEPFIDKDPAEVTRLCLKFDGGEYKEIKSMKDYIDTIINTFLTNRVSYDMPCIGYDLDVTGFDLFDFNMSYEDKVKMYLMNAQ